MNKHWQAKYFEKSAKESHVNIFRSLEIENYFKQLLKKKGYNLHSYRLNFSNSVLQIFISAYKKILSNKKKK
jgi:ribosomal protein S3